MVVNGTIINDSFNSNNKHVIYIKGINKLDL